MSYVAALVLNRVLQERLHAVFTGRHSLRLVHDADQLWASLRAHAVTLVIVEPTAAVNGPALVRAVRARYPGVPIAAYCRVRRGLSADILELVYAGVHALVLAEVDDDRVALTDLVARATGRSTADDVLEQVAAVELPTTAVDLLRQFLGAAGRPFIVRETASALGVHRRTLGKQLHRMGLPGPRDLAAWCRLLVAARLLDDSTHSVERVAHDLEFPSGNALRNLLRRHVGLSPTALRDRGGYEYVRARFGAVLARGRTAGATPDAPSAGHPGSI